MSYTSERLGLTKQTTNFSKVRIDDIPEVPNPGEPMPVRMPAAANDSTVISPNVEMSGTIVSPDELHIAGKIEGNVRASAIIIRASGSVRGEIVADTVVVHGLVEGRIHAQKVQLAAGATVRGDIIHAQLGIDTDALFEGASRRSKDPMADAPVVAIKAA